MSRRWKNREPVELTGSHPVQRSLSALRPKLTSAENSSPGQNQERFNPDVAERRGFLWLEPGVLPDGAFCRLRHEKARDHQQQHARNHTDIGDVENRVNRAKKRFVNRR